MIDSLIGKEYIPLDKSWIIRMGMLDLLNGYDDAVKFLQHKDRLSDDLKTLSKALADWRCKKIIDVGESGTIYRFFKFILWKNGLDKKFILHGTLLKRKICNDQKIIDYSLEKLLKLDNGTSQWASAAVLLGNTERIKNPPYKLDLTYKAVSHWKSQRAKGKIWKACYDETIYRQAKAFIELIKKGKTPFAPVQAEDYCFARAFGLITKEEGELRWPSLHGHESNRIKEMEKMLDYADKGKEINSKDHRVIQAVAMLQRKNKVDIKVKYPDAVNKSWPQFWDFIDNYS